MKKVIIGIGIPGSGKTTFLKPFAKEHDYMYICPDDIRAELSGDPMDHKQNAKVWEIAHDRLNESLKSGKTVVFDATSARINDRRGLVKFARDHGAEKIQGVFGAVPFVVAQERNVARGKDGGRAVPEEAMRRMYEMLKKDPPIVEDGFDSVFDINEFQELTRTEKQGESDVITREFRQKMS
jgi:predicted kinase